MAKLAKVTTFLVVLALLAVPGAAQTEAGKTLDEQDTAKVFPAPAREPATATAPEPAPSLEQGPVPAQPPEAVVFEPYIGRITGDSVNVRSGPAEVYYDVTKINKGHLVVVREEKQGWCKIDPTPGCFSYIAVEFVKLIEADLSEPSAETDAQDADEPAVENDASTTADDEPAGEDPTAAPAESSQADASAETDDAAGSPEQTASPLAENGLRWGTVVGDNVRVRAGSIKVPPQYASEVQTKLSSPAKVHIIGRRGDFYKIATPPGSYFWVAGDFVERLGPVTPDALTELKEQVLTAAALTDVPKNLSEQRLEYQKLTAAVKAERAKPLEQQNFEPLRKRLDSLLGQTESVSLKASVDTLQRHLERCEVALAIWQQSRKEDRQLTATLSEIDQQMELLMAVKPPAPNNVKDIVVKGTLAESAVFTAPNKNRRFLVLDDSERIIYYALAEKEGLDLAGYLGKNVSMVGQVQYDSFGKVRLLHVHEVVELPQGPAVMGPAK